MAERARWRSALLLVGFALCAAALEGRILYLQLVDRDFLAEQANDRHLRTVQISAHRGSLTDRYGEPLAVSTPVDTIYANPKELKSALDRLGELAAALEQDDEWLARRITSNLEREFVFLEAARAAGEGAARSRSRPARRRHDPRVPPLLSRRRGHGPRHRLHRRRRPRPGRPRSGVRSLAQGRARQQAGHAGPARPSRSATSSCCSAARPGRDLRTSIDLRLQYLAYRELKAAVADSGARWGSVVVLDPRTGEVLAMVNQPSYNPNAIASQYRPENFRNRAITDMFEPGSSFKPLVMAAALESGAFNPRTHDRHVAGRSSINDRVITEDPTNLGRVDLTTVLAKSSNVGAARVALTMEPQAISDVLTRLRHRPADRQRFPRRVGRRARRPEALAHDRPGDAVLRLWCRRHDVAARARLRRDRGRRHAAARVAARARPGAGGAARDLRRHGRRSHAHARSRRLAGGHRVARGRSATFTSPARPARRRRPASAATTPSGTARSSPALRPRPTRASSSSS